MARMAVQFLPNRHLPIFRHGGERFGGGRVDPIFSECHFHHVGEARQFHPLTDVAFSDAELRADGRCALGLFRRQFGKGFGLVQEMHGLADKVLR